MVLLWLVKPQHLRVAGRSHAVQSRAALMKIGKGHLGMSMNTLVHSF